MGAKLRTRLPEEQICIFEDSVINCSYKGPHTLIILILPWSFSNGATWSRKIAAYQTVEQFAFGLVLNVKYLMCGNYKSLAGRPT